MRHSLATGALLLVVSCIGHDPAPAEPKAPAAAANLPTAAGRGSLDTASVTGTDSRPCSGGFDLHEDHECCAGLTRVMGRLHSDGTCAASESIFHNRPFCSPCGDGLCDRREDRCNCPADCAPTTSRPAIRYQRGWKRPVQSPKVLVNWQDGGNIMAIATAIETALVLVDIESCDHLPEAEAVIFDHGDYGSRAPYRAEWVAYCRILVDGHSGRCNRLERVSTTPSLISSCETYFEAVAQQKLVRVEDCLAGFPADFPHTGEVRSCMLPFLTEAYGPDRHALEMRVADPPEIAPHMIDLYGCLELPLLRWPVDGKPDQTQCLTDLAVKSREAKFCELTRDPPECRKTLAARP